MLTVDRGQGHGSVGGQYCAQRFTLQTERTWCAAEQVEGTSSALTGVELERQYAVYAEFRCRSGKLGPAAILAQIAATDHRVGDRCLQARTVPETFLHHVEFFHERRS